MKRIKGSFPDQQPVTTRAEVFQDLMIDVNYDPVDWINPLTGSSLLCKPDHAIECLRWEDNMEDKPHDIVVGPQWCADPSFYIRTGPSDDYVEPSRRVLHYQSKNRQEYNSSQTVSDDEEETKDAFEAESVFSEDDHELEDKQEVYADAVDDEELSEVATVTESERMQTLMKRVNLLRLQEIKICSTLQRKILQCSGQPIIKDITS